MGKTFRQQFPKIDNFAACSHQKNDGMRSDYVQVNIFTSLNIRYSDL